MFVLIVTATKRGADFLCYLEMEISSLLPFLPYSYTSHRSALMEEPKSCAISLCVFPPVESLQHKEHGFGEKEMLQCCWVLCCYWWGGLWCLN